MASDVLLLKQRIDKLVTSLSTSSFTDSVKSDFNSCLETLESLKVDREVLQTTRIGSSLTKLSKSLENHCKDSSNKISNIIERWKNQLRSSTPTNPTKRQKTIESTDSSSNLVDRLGTADFSSPSYASSLTKDFSLSNKDLSNLNKNSPFQSKFSTSNVYDNNLANLNQQTSSVGPAVLHDANALGAANSLLNFDSKRSTDSLDGSTASKFDNSYSNTNLSHSSSFDSTKDGFKEDDFDLPVYSGILHRELIRDKALRYLFRCFLVGQDFGPELNKLNELIFDIENALYDHYIANKNSQKEYNLQLKCISFNFKDVKNTFFNYKVYSGLIPVTELVTMSSLQMASDEKKLERSEILEQSLEACQSDWAIKNIFLNQKSKGQFKCGKCNSRQTTYYQLQTRSSDEPMTTFVTCLNCKNRWRF